MPTQPSFDRTQTAALYGGYWGSGLNERFVGTDAAEQFSAGGGNDRVEAGGGDDRVYAGIGDDTVLAGSGNDFVTGDDGRDSLEGGEGRDTLYGGTGDDTLSGGAGDGDILSGGSGADLYVIRRGDGRDVVEGLNRAEGDRIDLTDFAAALGGIDSLAGLVASGRVSGTAQYGGDTLIRLSDTDVLTIRWINPRDLRAEQFVFAVPPANAAPTGIALSNAVVAENAAPGTAVGTLSATDPNAGDTATFALLDDAGGAFRLAADGVTLLATRAFDYEPEPRSYEVTVRATDAGGLSVDKVLTVAVSDVDEGVTAVADRYDATEDAVLEVSADQGVLVNDLASDGARTAMASTYATTRGGTVEINTDGSFRYTPPADFNGADGFYYVLRDVDGDTAIGAVTLEVAGVNDAPVANADSAATNEDSAILVNVLANDSDVDGGALGIALLPVTSAWGAALSVVDGQVRYDPTASSELQGLAAGQSVTDSFAYTVGDGRGGTATATVTVTVAGAAEPNPGSITGSRENFTAGDDGSVFFMQADAIFGTAVTTNAYTGETTDITGFVRSLDSYDLGGGFDSLAGTSGNDVLLYDSTPFPTYPGDTTRVGATNFAGIDQFVLQGGNDVINLTAGPNGSRSYAVNVTIIGGNGAGNDVLWSGSGNDVLIGENNLISSGTVGNDRLHGGAGNDTLFGDTRTAYGTPTLGNDTLNGGTGNDVLYGDAQAFQSSSGALFTGVRGTDLFVFDGPGSGTDQIGDFQHGLDRIQLSSRYGLTAAQALARTADNAAGNAVVDLGNGDAVTLFGVSKAGLTASDFAIL